MSIDEFFKTFNVYLEHMLPVMVGLMGITLGITGALLIIREVTKVFAALDVTIEVDQRKKKKEEYDDYYDQRLAEHDEPETDMNIAYYDTGGDLREERR